MTRSYGAGRRARVLALGVVAGAIGLAGCSGSADDVATGGRPGDAAATGADDQTDGQLPVAEAGQPAERSPQGAEVFGTVCARCHAGAGTSRAPGYTSLSSMSPRAIYDALDRGRMQVHGDALEDAQKRAVAQWLTGREVAATPIPRSAYCRASPPLPGDAPIRWSGWGGDATGTGFRSAEQAGLTPDDIRRLELRWAFGFPDGTVSRSTPAVVGNHVLVGGQFGELFSLDLETGCLHWLVETDAAIRGAVVIGEGPGEGPSAFVVDFRSNAYAFDVATGDLQWRTGRVGAQQDASVTGSPAYHDGRLYVPISSMEVVNAGDPAHPCCTSSGEVVALDARDGTEVWRHRVIEEPAREVGRTEAGTPILAPSGAPVWSSPTVDAARGLLYIGTGENYTRPASATSDAVQALRLETGEVAWSFQATEGDAYNLACVAPSNRQNCPSPLGPDLDFGMAPILAAAPDGRPVLLAGQKAGIVWALDPDADGEVVWATRVGKGSALGGIHWGMAVDGRRVYAANSDTPFGMLGIEPDHPAAPGLFALELGGGEIVWRAPDDPAACEGRQGCVPGRSAAPTAIPGAVFSGGLDGHLRAYATGDGALLWDYDTARAFDTVNGVPARGGAIDGPGPVVAAGFVLVDSGYGLFNQMPGNVLLAFAPGGR